MLDFKLYAMTDRWIAKDLNQFAAKATMHGLRALRMRELDLNAENLLQVGMELRMSVGSSKLMVSVPLGAPNEVEVTGGFAIRVAAQGVHFPERLIGSFPALDVLHGKHLKLLCGVSIHSADAAQRAESWGADFVTFGSVFETPSKRAMGFEPQGLDKLKEVVKAVKIPVFAIGGITPMGAKACMDQGAWGVAVIRDLLLAPNLQERMEQYREVLGTL